MHLCKASLWDVYFTAFFVGHVMFRWLSVRESHVSMNLHGACYGFCISVECVMFQCISEEKVMFHSVSKGRAMIHSIMVRHVMFH